MTPGDVMLWALAVLVVVVVVCLIYLMIVGVIRQRRVQKAEDQVVSEVQRWAQSGPPEPPASERGKGSQK